MMGQPSGWRGQILFRAGEAGPPAPPIGAGAEFPSLTHLFSVTSANIAIN